MSDSPKLLLTDKATRLRPAPALTNITNSAHSSPVRPGSRSGFSPIRRSGSPMRRKQIQEIEDSYRQLTKRTAEPPEQPGKRPKNVSFNKNVQYFEDGITSSPTRVDSLEQSLHKLTQDVDEIKQSQAALMTKLDYLITLLDKQ